MTLCTGSPLAHARSTVLRPKRLISWCRVLWSPSMNSPHHKTLHQLIKRFGLRTVDLAWARGDPVQSVMYFFNRYYGAEELARDFQVLAPLLQQQTQEVNFPTTHAHYTETAYRLDNLSVYDWIEQYVEGGHNGPFGRLLESGCSGYFGLGTAEQSSLNLPSLFCSRVPP